MSAEVQFTQLIDLLDANVPHIEMMKNQYLELLSGLTYVNPLPTDLFMRRIERINDIGSIVVGVVKDEQTPFRIVASGTIIIEPKVIHGGKCVGHIEDIVVAPDMRKQGIGQKLLDLLKWIARENNCYKVILDCSDTVCPVYEKNGLRIRGVQMAEYFDE